jgi:hypothetical protein
MSYLYFKVRFTKLRLFLPLWKNQEKKLADLIFLNLLIQYLPVN